MGLLLSKLSHVIATDDLSAEESAFSFEEMEEKAFIQYTSGTTANPKGVIISHDNIAHNLALIGKAFNINPDSKGLIWLPPYHDMGLIGGILVPLYHRFPVVLTSPFNFIKNPLIWLELISKYKATISGGPNFAYNLCTSKANEELLSALDLSSWEVAFCGAEPINHATMHAFLDKFKPCGLRPYALLPCYGNAESTLIVSSTEVSETLNVVQVKRDSLGERQIIFDSSEHAVHFVDCGKPLVNVTIIDPETRSTLEENQIGEVVIGGKSISSGYWNNPEKTKAAFKIGADAERYYHSGDLGFISNGKLYITGRINDLIIIGGRNFYAHEIEAVVQSCNPDIRGGCCIAYESSQSGTSKLRLAVEVKQRKSINYEELMQQIFVSINQNFGIAAEVVDLVKPHTVLKTTSGKLQRCQSAKYIQAHPECILFHYDINTTMHKTNRELAQNRSNYSSSQSSECAGKISQELIEKKLIQLIRESYPNSLAIKPKTSLECLGLDSILYVKLLTNLQQALSIEFEISDVIANKNQSIRKLAGEISQNIKVKQQIRKLEELPKIKKLMEMYTNLTIHGYDKLYLRAYESASNSIIKLEGKDYINFASYNYLGLSDHSEVKQFIKDTVDQYGSSASASRLVAGNRVITEALEKSLADFLGFDDAIVFTAGYQTVVSTITHLFGQGDAIIYDELAHNSSLLGALYSGADLFVFKHNDVESLATQLADIRHKYEKILIVTESVFSMDGDISPIDKIIALKKQYECFLMIDEAHSIGVIGNTGRGVLEYYKQSPEDVDLIIGTLSKALSSCGGFVCASEHLIKYLKYSAPGFVFSAGITPANAAAAFASLRILKNHPELISKMQENAAYFLHNINELGLDSGMSKNTPIIPIIIGDSQSTIEASYQLFQNGICAPPIIAPGVTENQARIRFFITALHHKEQIDRCMEQLDGLKKRLFQC